jgi:hypothetical protein
VQFRALRGLFGVSFPLGQHPAGSGEQHEAVFVHPAVYQAGTHGVGDHLLEPLPRDAGRPADGISPAPGSRAVAAYGEKSGHECRCAGEPVTVEEAFQCLLLARQPSWQCLKRR